MRATGRYPSADVEIPAEQERGEDGNQAECNHNHFIISLPTRLGAREAIIILIVVIFAYMKLFLICMILENSCVNLEKLLIFMYIIKCKL